VSKIYYTCYKSDRIIEYTIMQVNIAGRCFLSNAAILAMERQEIRSMCLWNAHGLSK